jgi:hypothetical protein
MPPTVAARGPSRGTTRTAPTDCAGQAHLGQPAEAHACDALSLSAGAAANAHRVRLEEPPRHRRPLASQIALAATGLVAAVCAQRGTPGSAHRRPAPAGTTRCSASHRRPSTVSAASPQPPKLQKTQQGCPGRSARKGSPQAERGGFGLSRSSRRDTRIACHTNHAVRCEMGRRAVPTINANVPQH